LINSEVQIAELIRRTMGNLKFIREVEMNEQRRGAKRSVYCVTQMINSTLALIIHPWEAKSGIFEADLSAVESEGWPRLRSSRPRTDDPEPLKIRDQVAHFRHGLAHGYIQFHSDGQGEISAIEIENRLPPNRCRPERGNLKARSSGDRLWGAKISVTELEAILEFIADRYQTNSVK
jgi:hypothetical protein